jgi:hypothetical protein
MAPISLAGVPCGPPFSIREIGLGLQTTTVNEGTEDCHRRVSLFLSAHRRGDAEAGTSRRVTTVGSRGAFLVDVRAPWVAAVARGAGGGGGFILPM